MHPNGSKELYFCFDCSRVFCKDCRSIEIEHVNHMTHRTAPFQEVLNHRKERLPEIRKLIVDYTEKHYQIQTALLKLEEEPKTQTNELNRLIDDFASQLHFVVDYMKSEAKATIAKRSSNIWSSNPAVISLKEIANELQKMREVRAAIDHELRLCDRDELYLVEKNKDTENAASALSEFLGKTFDIPEKSCYQLAELRRELLDRMSRLQFELNRSKEALLKDLQEPYFTNPDELSLVLNSTLAIRKEKLLLPNDTDKSPFFYGSIPACDNTEAIYFVDRNNSKIKMWDLKTSQLTEVSQFNNI